MIKAIIFDVSGVITKGSFARAFSKNLYQKYNVDEELAFQTYKAEESDYLINKESQESFLKRMAKILNIEFNYEELSDMFIESSTINIELFDMVKKLHENYDLHIASDNYKELVDYLRRKLNFQDYFKIILFSNEVGMRKKEIEFFNPIVDKYNPKECVYIDDREKYIDIGKQIGFNTIQFKNNEQLKKDMNKLGVNI